MACTRLVSGIIPRLSQLQTMNYQEQPRRALKTKLATEKYAWDRNTPKRKNTKSTEILRGKPMRKGNMAKYLIGQHHGNKVILRQASYSKL